MLRSVLAATLAVAAVGLLPGSELAVAVSLLPAHTAGWDGVAAVGLLTVFTAAIALALARGQSVDCVLRFGRGATC